MHELSLTYDVVDAVVDAARRSGASKVVRVHMTVGEVRDVVEDLMRPLFARIAKGTVAEGAEIVFKRTPYMARCRSCGNIFRLKIFDKSTWGCGECGSKDYTLHTGMEFNIDKIEVE